MIGCTAGRGWKCKRVFFFERTNRICQSNFTSQDLLRELLQHTKTLLEPSTADDQFADKVEQALEPFTADANHFPVFAGRRFFAFRLIGFRRVVRLDDGRFLGCRLNRRLRRWSRRDFRCRPMSRRFPSPW